MATVKMKPTVPLTLPANAKPTTPSGEISDRARTM